MKVGYDITGHMSPNSLEKEIKGYIQLSFILVLNREGIVGVMYIHGLILVKK